MKSSKQIINKYREYKFKSSMLNPATTELYYAGILTALKWVLGYEPKVLKEKKRRKAK